MTTINEKEISLLDIFAVMKRQRRFIMGSLLLCFLFALGFAIHHMCYNTLVQRIELAHTFSDSTPAPIGQQNASFIERFLVPSLDPKSIPLITRVKFINKESPYSKPTFSNLYLDATAKFSRFSPSEKAVIKLKTARFVDALIAFQQPYVKKVVHDWKADLAFNQQLLSDSEHLYSHVNLSSDKQQQSIPAVTSPESRESLSYYYQHLSVLSARIQSYKQKIFNSQRNINSVTPTASIVMTAVIPPSLKKAGLIVFGGILIGFILGLFFAFFAEVSTKLKAVSGSPKS